MTGIDYEVLSSLGPKVKIYYEDAETQLSSLKNEFEHLKGCCNGIDLNFLYNRYGEEIEQFDNIMLKAEAYYLTLEEVVKGYKSQEASIANEMKNNNFDNIV